MYTTDKERYHYYLYRQIREGERKWRAPRTAERGSGPQRAAGERFYYHMEVKPLQDTIVDTSPLVEGLAGRRRLLFFTSCSDDSKPI